MGKNQDVSQNQHDGLWSLTANSTEWTRNTKVSSTDLSVKPEIFRPLRKALGIYGSVAILGGTITILGLMGFLVFLWTGEGLNEGQNALSTWRYIILEQWITQAITLTSLVLQVTNAAQASVCTGLVAAMTLERHGVPLSRVAEYSLIRSNNDGPLRLSWLMLSSCRRFVAPQMALVFMLLVGTIAVQFTSTILVSDLKTSTIVGNAQNVSRGVSASLNTLNQFHLVNQYSLQPSFVPFGEIAGSDPSPTQSGVSDTGIVKRIHPFVPQANRTNIRLYDGRSFVFNSRVVCMAPILQRPTLDIHPVANPAFTNHIITYILGDMLYNQTFQEAGVPSPPGCPAGACFPSAFNCSVALRTGIPGRPGITGCLPSGRNAVLPSFNSTITQSPIANTSEVFIFIKSNIEPEATMDNFTTVTPYGTVRADEWTTYNFDGNVSLDVTLCFQQLNYDRAMVRLSTDRNLEDKSVGWVANTTNWDTSSVRTLFDTSLGSPSNRGLYTVDYIKNSTRSSTTQYLTNVMILNNYESFEYGNITLFLSPYGGGTGSFFPHVAYEALFADTIQQTNRPAVAFQNLITALSGSMIDGLLTQLDVMENITTISSVSVSAPQRYLGLAFVLSINIVNLTTVIIVVSLFLIKTKHTSAGNYWHAVAQVDSEVTQPILHRATQSTDDEIAKMLEDEDIKVKLEYRGLSGRVEVVRCHEATT